jgi:hypothetical protein
MLIKVGSDFDGSSRNAGGRATLRIRSQPSFPARIWSFATDPTLCPQNFTTDTGI